MKFEPLPFAGAVCIKPNNQEDSRGGFMRTFCAKEFEEHNLCTAWVQCNLSHNRNRGTLRGLHWQAEPHSETKLIRAMRGVIWDVVVDLRHGSPTFCQWYGQVLDADAGTMLYIPRGFAHGFLTLRDDSDVFYWMSQFYTPEAAKGARYDDAAFGIDWPFEGGLNISDRDLSFPKFEPHPMDPLT